MKGDTEVVAIDEAQFLTMVSLMSADAWPIWANGLLSPASTLIFAASPLAQLPFDGDGGICGQASGYLH